MVRKIKNAIYFLVARYFRFFAAIRLSRWKPRIVVITGSNGKTTTLNLLEAQLGPGARYSHGANSSFGIPFDILGLKRKSYSVFEWPLFALLAPFKTFGKVPREKVYVVEADCDRPFEGAFLSSLLKPEIVVWLSSDRTHSMNFDSSVSRGKFKTVDEAIAHEYAHFIEQTSKLVIVNADNQLIERESAKARADVCGIREEGVLERYSIDMGGSHFTVAGKEYSFPYLLPKETFYALFAATTIVRYFGKEPREDIALVLPPSRSSVFEGIKNTTLIDSTYNANAASVGAILRMVEMLPHTNKWLVIGDMTEQGVEEKEEHEKVAHLLEQSDYRKIVLVGPRMEKYVSPLLASSAQRQVFSLSGPKEALQQIRSSLQGGEMLVFKGARFLEGVVEELLADPHDAAKLCRREPIWQKRRKQFGL